MAAMKSFSNLKWSKLEVSQFQLSGQSLFSSCFLYLGLLNREPMRSRAYLEETAPLVIEEKLEIVDRKMLLIDVGSSFNSSF